MGFAINIIFFGIAFVTLAIAGGFATSASARVSQIPNWTKDENLELAHKYLTTAAIVTWISIAVMITLIILYLVFGLETASIPGVVTILTYLFLFGTLVLIGVVGILSAMAAAKINESKIQDDNGSYQQAIIAAVLAIVGAVGMIAVILVRFFYKPKTKEEKAADKEKAQADELKQAIQIKKLQDFIKAKKAAKIAKVAAAKQAAAAASTPASTTTPAPTTTETPLDRVIKNCPAYNVDLTTLDCGNRKTNLKALHPDKNIGCTKLASTKFVKYKDICQ